MSSRMRCVAVFSLLLHLLLIVWLPDWQGVPEQQARPLPLSVELIAPQLASEHVIAPQAKPSKAMRAIQPKTNLQPTVAKPLLAEPVLSSAQQAVPVAIKPAAVPTAAEEINSGTAQNANPPPSQRADAAEGQGVQPANFNAAYLSNPKPEVPFIAKQRCQSGLLKLRVLVSATGRVVRANIEKGSGCEPYDRSALETVKNHWRFEPGLRGGAPIESEVIIPLRLNLVDKE